MSTLLEVEKLAFELPESQRATLAAHLLESLPAVMRSEAVIRDEELDCNPEAGLSIEELDCRIASRRERREQQKSMACEAMGSLAGCGTTEEFLRSKHTAGERW